MIKDSIVIVTSARGCRIENHVTCCKALTRNAVITEEEETFLDVQLHFTHIGLFSMHKLQFRQIGLFSLNKLHSN